MWAWIRRKKAIVAGCALMSGVAVGMIEEVRHATVGYLWNLAFPAPPDLVACLDAHIAATPRPTGPVYLIVVTQLRGDDDGRHLDQIARTLTRLYGEDIGSVIQVESVPCTLLKTGGNVASALTEARDAGLDLLHRAEADVVIWGDVLQSGRQIELRFLAQEDENRGDFAADGVVLDAEFNSAIGAIIAAKAATRVALSPEDAGSHVVARMERVLAITTPLVGALPQGLPPESLATIWNAHGQANYWVGLQSGSDNHLELAVSAYGQALANLDRADFPLDWATAQNDLGAALGTLGQREAGTARLEQAVEAYRAALEERSREEVPLDWAATQNNLGTALATLGMRESDTVRLEQAVQAFQTALEERTRDRVPLDWAMTQNNLGNALRNLGARESGTTRLEEAVEAYRAALQEYSRDRVPLDWAMTQNNLGNALQTLGARETGTARLEEAAEAYRAALEERTRDRVPLDWAMTQGNLASVETTFFTRTADPTHLDRAEALVRDALEVFTEGGATQYIAMAERQLADIAALLPDHSFPINTGQHR
jgi:tetratricopeptide (TPR) repeat protein